MQYVFFNPSPLIKRISMSDTANPYAQLEHL